MINFPSDPVLGQTFSVGEKSWQWNGTSWTVLEVFPGVGVVVSTGVAWGTSLTVPQGTLVGTGETYSDPSWVSSLSWNKLTTTPTTLSGYGITDAQALDADLTAIAGLTGTSGFLKKTAANTWSLDTSTYLTGNQSISVSGDATGSGTTAIALTLANSGVTAGTYTKITVDAKGRATAGTALSASDIPSLDASKITTGTFDAARLPSYVDDVLEYANLAGFPASGETGKIYVALDTNKTYRWSGSAYIYITSGAVDSVAGKTGVVTLVKGDVGLGNVDNTADANKNVLSATKFTTARTINGVSFDGTANITVADSTKLPLTGGTLTGNITLDAGTANGVAYLDGSKVLTTGSALTFDGTNLGIGTSSPGAKLSIGDTSTTTSNQIRLHGPASGTAGGASINVVNGTDTIFAAGNASNIIGGSYSSDGMIFWGNAALRFYGNGAERMRLDSSGNLGLGVTPSAWNSGTRAFQFGIFGALWGGNDGGTRIGFNAIETGTNTYTYRVSVAAMLYAQTNLGGHAWYTAPSGTAGNVITFTQAMTLDASGNLYTNNGKIGPNATQQHTMPAVASDTFTLNAATQTLTNKTIREMTQIISGNTSAAASNIYVLTASLTLTLPATPTAGDWVGFSNRSGTTTPVIARNGSNIMGLAEDLTLNSVNASGTLVYTDATRGWVFVD